jgi:hypothetical protein
VLRSWFAFGAALAAGFALACVVDLPEDGAYRCATDADCGGGGYVCAPSPDGGVRACCLASAGEACDGKDNDCNGLVDDIAPVPCYSGDPNRAGVGVCRRGLQGCTGGCVGEVLPSTEQCNSLDDDCDALVDEDFDLRNDPARCGGCTNACNAGQICLDGTCLLPSETVCNDDLDNDQDTRPDCADPDCNNQSCDAGCVCLNLRATEVACFDQADNDRDTLVDCVDVDCDGGSCGQGCRCGGGRPNEIACGDDSDNDLDSSPDCADPDCDNQSCDAGCVCRSLRATEIACSDLADNDQDMTVDCGDVDCDGGSCGQGCRCSGGQRTESACTDYADNDGDLQIDGCDLECAGSCDAGCQCDGGVPQETNCSVNPLSGDEDNDGRANCLDPDCLGAVCRASPLRTCRASGNCQ